MRIGKGRKACAFFPLKILDIHFIQLFLFLYLFPAAARKMVHRKAGRGCPSPGPIVCYMLFYSGIRMLSASEIPRCNKKLTVLRSSRTASSSRLTENRQKSIFSRDSINSSKKDHTFRLFVPVSHSYRGMHSPRRTAASARNKRFGWSDRERIHRPCSV